ncbi:MAG TPA: patatin-like phospholipase family protein [Syntrophomonadaceae bacterium]|nr:patatin-like phospholipase family protein [Syntrophomonadaceae bacterium]HPU48953.1 patatin-like phospholipase family protein [Syntrophomonadaceae bacterium]
MQDRGKRLGVALGGGGLRGFAHIGVLQVLEDKRIPISYLSGTSAGALVAALYASGLSAYRIEELARSLQPSDYLDYNISGLFKYILSRYLPGMDAPLQGIIKGDKIQKIIYQWTGGKSLQDCKLPLAIIACDIDSGREVVFTNQNLEWKTGETVVVQDALLSEAVRASIAIPATFVPLDLAGMQLVDGGLKSIVPVTAQKVMGAEYIMAVNLGTSYYREKVAGIPSIISRSISILTYETSETEQRLFADLVIKPRVQSVGLDDWEEALGFIRAGRRAMLRQVEKLEKDLYSGPYCNRNTAEHIYYRQSNKCQQSLRRRGGG